MVLSQELSNELASLKQRLDKLEDAVLEASDEEDEEDDEDEEDEEDEGDEEDEDNEGGRNSKELIVILKRICALVRREYASNNSQLAELVEATQELLNQGINVAYGESELFDFLPSWAHDNEHDEPLIKDRGETAMSFLRE